MTAAVTPPLPTRPSVPSRSALPRPAVSRLAAAPLAVALLAGCGSDGRADPAGAGDVDAVSNAGASPAAAQGIAERAPDTGAVALPIEVLGDGTGETIESVRFAVDGGAGIDALRLACHRCGYRDASTNPLLGPKGSVRLNGGPWVALDDASVDVAERDRRWGGIAGGFHTVRFDVPVTGAVDGENALDFRFEGTDGFTTGYRILALNPLANGRELLPPSAFVEDDPADWTAPVGTDEAAVARGRALWTERGALLDSPSGPALAASCADCHTDGAIDLKYFNYSNRSIEVRSRFHGLSADDARAIAAYVRTRDHVAPAAARPWNPPYQPGPGLDDRPVLEWAAGAGLDAVLEGDADMLPFLFPDGTSRAAIRAAVDTRATLNAREMPIALPLPDWNAWLPEDHPLDVFGEAWEGASPATELARVTAALDGGGATAMRTDPARVRSGDFLRDGPNAVQRAIRAFSRVGGPQPCRNAGVHDGPAAALLGREPYPGDGRPPMDEVTAGDPDFCERPMRALHHWSAVKQWELGQRFSLEDAPPDVYAHGEARGWASSERQVFDMAPHRTGNDSFTFAHLDRRTSSYFNTAWYQLQVVLNAGNRRPLNHRPPDWKYQLNHLAAAVEETGDPQSLRHVQTLIKMWQNLDMRGPADAPATPSHRLGSTDEGPTKDGWWLTHVAPWRLLNVGGSFWNDAAPRYAMWDELDAVEPGLRVAVQDALLEAWLDKSGTYPTSAWPRGEGQDNVNPVGYVPTPHGDAHRVADSGTTADGVYRAIPLMHEAGMDPASIERLRAWGASMWPAGDWAALRR